MAAGLVDPSTSVSTVISTAVSQPAACWFDAFGDEDKAYITARGLAEKDPLEAFLETAKAHREAQAYIGVPRERLLTLPAADAAPEAWDAIYEKLGFSKNADDYKLDDIKYTDGTALEPDVAAFIREQAQALELSPTQAQAFAKASVAFSEKSGADESSEAQIAAARAAEALRQNWGPNYQANMAIADRAFNAMQAAAGFTADQMKDAMTKLRDVQGVEGVMQMLFAVGQRLGEDGFVDGGRAPADPNALVASVAQAQARKQELMGDADWRKRYLEGGTKEANEMRVLDMRIAGYNENGDPL